MFLGRYPNAGSKAFFKFIVDNNVRLSAQLEVDSDAKYTSVAAIKSSGLPQKEQDHLYVHYQLDKIGDSVSPAPGITVKLIQVDTLPLPSSIAQNLPVSGPLVDKHKVITRRSYLVTGKGPTSYVWHSLAIPWIDFSVMDNKDWVYALTVWDNIINSITKGGVMKPGIHIHCAGGKGRTGSFALSRTLCKNEPPTDTGRDWTTENVQSVLRDMRKSRGKLVETPEQLLRVLDAANACRKVLASYPTAFPPADPKSPWAAALFGHEDPHHEMASAGHDSVHTGANHVL